MTHPSRSGPVSGSWRLINEPHGGRRMRCLPHLRWRPLGVDYLRLAAHAPLRQVTRPVVGDHELVLLVHALQSVSAGASASSARIR